MIFLFYVFLEPRIVSGPYLQNLVTSVKDFPVKIECKIASHFILKATEVYLLRNGFTKLSSSVQNIYTGHQSVSTVLQSSLNESYNTQGYYQCVVFVSNIMRQEVMSKKLHFQFQGNHFLFTNNL